MLCQTQSNEKYANIVTSKIGISNYQNRYDYEQNELVFLPSSSLFIQRRILWTNCRNNKLVSRWPLFRFIFFSHQFGAKIPNTRTDIGCIFYQKDKDLEIWALLTHLSKKPCLQKKKPLMSYQMLTSFAIKNDLTTKLSMKISLSNIKVVSKLILVHQNTKCIW